MPLFTPLAPVQDVTTPRCDCRCDPLKTGWLVISRTASGNMNGIPDILADGAQTGSGRWYKKKDATSEYLDPNTGEVVFTEHLITTYDPATDTFAERTEPPDGRPIGAVLGNVTYAVSEEYTPEAFLSDLKTKLADQPWPDWPDPQTNLILGNVNVPAPGSTLTSTGFAYGNSYVNKVANLSAEITSARYKAVVYLDNPWTNPPGQSIELRWRELTKNYTQTASANEDPTETGSRVYVERSLSLTPQEDDLHVVSGEYDLDVEMLTMGDGVSLVGLGDLETLNFILNAQRGWEAGFALYGKAGSARKRGAGPYLHDSTQDPAVPVYQREAASGANPATGAGYAGSYQFGKNGVWTNPGDPPDDYDENTFSGTVPPAYSGALDAAGVSSAATSPLDLQVSHATLVQPTKVTFDNGLTLELSQEYTTSQMRTQPDQDAQADFPEEFYPEGAPFLSDVALLAKRFLAKSERSYEVLRSWWQPVLRATLDDGVKTRVEDGDDPLPVRGDIQFDYKRSVVDLDTGEVNTTTVHGSAHYDAAEDPVLKMGQDPQVEPVPTSNQMVLVHDVEIIAMDQDDVRIGAVARIKES